MISYGWSLLIKTAQIPVQLPPHGAHSLQNIPKSPYHFANIAFFDSLSHPDSFGATNPNPFTIPGYSDIPLVCEYIDWEGTLSFRAQSLLFNT
jgi:hypothetical protein